MRPAALACVLAACATVPAATERPRPRGPSDESTDAAFQAVSASARQCLEPGQSATVGGFFEGASGAFLAERVVLSGQASVRVQQCVSLAMERARTTPFGAGQRDAQWTISPPAGSSRDAGSGAVATSSEPVGDIDASQVARTMRAEVPEIRRCYEDELRANPRLSGRLEVGFTLSVDGRMTYAVASGPRGFRPVGHCILGHLRRLQWPAARGGSVDFRFPFTFTPER